MEREGPNLTNHNNELFSKSYRSALDLSLFPVLTTVNQPQISSLRTHVSDGQWSPSNIDSLIAGFPVVDQQDIPPVAGRSAQLDPSPSLTPYSQESLRLRRVIMGGLWELTLWLKKYFPILLAAR